MQTTEELVKSALLGDEGAVSALVRRYEHTAIATAGAIVGDFHHAQDVTQESFVDAFRKLKQLRNPPAFGPWLLTIVRRNAQRARKRNPPQHHGLDQLGQIESRNSWESEFRELMPLLARLPEQERIVVNLRYFGGLNLKQIASETRRPPGTVSKQLSRAVERLQGMLAEVNS